MAAGLGFKTFTTGEVLTAADTNGYLMQGVLVFASAAARDAAITSPQEGQCCYLKDTDAVLTYSGSAWVGFDDTNAIQNSIVDAKGDIVAASAADTPARLAVGANASVLTADSTASTGLKWVTPPAFYAYTSGTAQSVTTATQTKVQFKSESFDTNSNFDSTTNYRFTPTVAGYYQINTTGLCATTSGTLTRVVWQMWKNGAEVVRAFDINSATNANFMLSGSSLIYFNGSTDYLEIYVYATGTNIVVGVDGTLISFSGTWIRS